MNKKGFTLVELLAVIVILAIILAIAVPTISSLIEVTKINAFTSSAKMILKQVSLLKLDNPTFDISTINSSTISNYNISNENYRTFAVELLEENPYVYILGQKQWNGLIAKGTFNNMTVSKNDVVTTNLLGWWRLNSNALDFLNINNGTIIGSVSSITRNGLNALTFNGPNNYIDLGSSLFDTINDDHEMTICAWINSKNNNYENWIVSQYAASTKRFILDVYTNGKLRYFRGGVSIHSNAVMSLNQWYFVAVTKQSNGTIKMYINGILDATGNLNGSYDVTNTKIGMSYPSYFSQYSLDDVMIYSRVLTDSEIIQNYNAQK